MLESLKKYSPFDRSRLRSMMVVAGIILGLTGVARPESVPLSIGVLMMAGGFILHFICKAHLRQDEEVTRSGPYRWVRHPFYTANALIDGGLLFVINVPVFALVFGICWGIAYYRQIRGEETFLTDKFGDTYREYKYRVPALIPWKLPLSAEETGESHFSVENPNIQHGKECSRLIRYSSYPYLIASCALVGRWGWDIFLSMDHLALIVPAMFVSLYWLGHTARGFVKEKSPPFPAVLHGTPARLIFSVCLLAGLIVAEGRLSEVEGVSHLSASILGGAGLLFVAGFLVKLHSCRVWYSYRFQVFFEMLFLIAMAFLSGLFYGIAVVTLFYAPLLLFGRSPLSGSRSLNQSLVEVDGSDTGRHLLYAVPVFSVGLCVLILQDILMEYSLFL